MNLEDKCNEVCDLANRLLHAEPVKPGKYKVVIDQKLAGVFAHEAFGHLSESDFLYENDELKKVMKLGKKFGPDNLNIIDDPTIPNLAGSYDYDDEGVKTRKNYLIKNGKLTGRLHSRETAYKMEEEVTGNARSISYNYGPIVRMSNTYIDNGNTDFNDMIKEIDNGIYAKGALGGMTNTEMFTFSAEQGYIIKNGEIKKLIRDVILTGNVFTTLHNIQRIGNDLKLFGGLGGCGKAGQSPLPVNDGGPHLSIKDVVIGGK
jgi:TldD protein